MDPQTVIARRIARELRDGMLVNLGIGIPTLVANFVPPGHPRFFPVRKRADRHRRSTGGRAWTTACSPTPSGKPVTALPGASTFDSAMSFGLIRGGHLP